MSSKVVRRERKFFVSVNCPFFSLVFVGPATRPHSLTRSCVHSCTNSSVYCLPHSHTDPVHTPIPHWLGPHTHSSTRSYTHSVHTPIPHSFTHWLGPHTHSSTHSHINSVHTLIPPLIHTLTRSTHSFLHSFTHWLGPHPHSSLIHTLTRSTHPFPTHSHTDSVHTPIPHSFTHWLGPHTHSPLIHTLTRSTHPFIHSFTCSFLLLFDQSVLFTQPVIHVLVQQLLVYLFRNSRSMGSEYWI